MPSPSWWRFRSRDAYKGGQFFCLLLHLGQYRQNNDPTDTTSTNAPLYKSLAVVGIAIHRHHGHQVLSGLRGIPHASHARARSKPPFEDSVQGRGGDKKLWVSYIRAPHCLARLRGYVAATATPEMPDTCSDDAPGVTVANSAWPNADRSSRGPPRPPFGALLGAIRWPMTLYCVRVLHWCRQTERSHTFPNCRGLCEVRSHQARRKLSSPGEHLTRRICSATTGNTDKGTVVTTVCR